METQDTALTRADLAAIVYEVAGLPKHECMQIVETLLEEIAATLEAGESVKISSFGSFHVRHKKERMGRNPKTGEQVPITPRRVLSFKASPVLKKKLNETI